MNADGIVLTILGALFSFGVGGGLVMWRRRNKHEDKTSSHGERLAALETSVAKLEKITERGFDRLADKIDTLPCRHGGHCPANERRIA